MKKYEHIFFDLDHTLWDFEKNSEETISELFIELELAQQYNIPDFGLFFSTYKKHNDFLWGLYTKDKINRKQLRLNRFVKTLRDFNINNRELTEFLADEYVLRCPNKTNLFPYTHEILLYLGKRYSVHIITNGFEEIQYRKMDMAGLRKYFKTITTSEKAKAKKPSKRIFNYALLQAKANIQNSILVGDTLDADILGAKNMGMDYIFFNPMNQQHCEEICMEINCLSKLFKLL